MSKKYIDVDAAKLYLRRWISDNESADRREQVCMCSDRSVLEEAITKRRNPKEWRITETANDKRKVCENCGAKMDKEKTNELDKR